MARSAKLFMDDVFVIKMISPDGPDELFIVPDGHNESVATQRVKDHLNSIDFDYTRVEFKVVEYDAVTLLERK